MSPSAMAVRAAIPDNDNSRPRVNSIQPAVPRLPTYHHHSIQSDLSAVTSPPPQQEEYHDRSIFKPPLPWYSAPDEPFPARKPRRKPQKAKGTGEVAPTEQKKSGVSTQPASEKPTPHTTAPPSEVDLTHPTTPSSTAPPSATPSIVQKPVVQVQAAVPAIVEEPIKPLEPKIPNKHQKEQPALGELNGDGAADSKSAVVIGGLEKTEEKPITPEPAPKPKPTWANHLFSGTNTKPATETSVVSVANRPVNGLYASMEDALKAFNIRDGVVNAPFLEPRGLINTGNMCFMNAVLQMLVFCGPFYYFLDCASKGAKSAKHDAPLIETMIMFMREFRVITPNTKSPIKSKDLEVFGESFAPEFVYEAIRKLNRFSHMRRGHQQDAEEFLGFLLDGLHEEAAAIMKSGNMNGTARTSGEPTSTSDDQWLEVGPRQKASTTRSTEIDESPITKIFGGKLRSVFKVPGLSDSVTLEPYTPLQLDIQAPEVKSVADALKHITIPEQIRDFKSPKGPNVTATKTVFIDSLPQILILHLKRFQYDSTGGTQKIWKKIAYPLELEIPKEAMSPMRRQGPRPRYRLCGVVYHHGTSAQGGHYTADVLRQDGKNWVRFDDTAITRVASTEVAVDIKDIAQYNDVEGDDQHGWEEVKSNGGDSPKVSGKKWVGKENKQAYILFYQKI